LGAAKEKAGYRGLVGLSSESSCAQRPFVVWRRVVRVGVDTRLPNSFFPNLVALDLSNNEIGDSGAIGLTKRHLPKNLLKLHLAKNSIGDSGGGSVGRKVVAPYDGLSNHPIRAVGICALGKAIERNSSLGCFTIDASIAGID